jgi:hypothetical protein
MKRGLLPKAPIHLDIRHELTKPQTSSGEPNQRGSPLVRASCSSSAGLPPPDRGTALRRRAPAERSRRSAMQARIDGRGHGNSVKT